MEEEVKKKERRIILISEHNIFEGIGAKKVIACSSLKKMCGVMGFKVKYQSIIGEALRASTKEQTEYAGYYIMRVKLN